MAKMAEGFNDLLTVTPIRNFSKAPTKNEINSLERVFLDQNYFQALAIIKQIEFNIKEFYFKGNKNELNYRIIENCQNLQSLSSFLQDKKMVEQVSLFLGNTSEPVENSIKRIFLYFGELRKSIFNEIRLKTKNNEAECYLIIRKLKKKYIKKAKFYFKRTKKISKYDNDIFPVIQQYAKITQDFQWLSEIQLEYIEEHPNDYLGPNYSELINAYVMAGNFSMAKKYCKKSIEIEEEFIQKSKNKFLGESYVRMANAYLTLKETRYAIMNFKKGAEEFTREREFLNQKSTRTDTDNQRIEMLNRELQNLKRFKEKLN